jgi:xanthine/uracil permease
MSSDDTTDVKTARSADAARAEIGWLRAIVTGVVVLFVGLGVSVVGANELIARLTSLSRDTVAYLASGFFVLCVLAAAWLLRRLQDRGAL